MRRRQGLSQGRAAPAAWAAGLVLLALGTPATVRGQAAAGTPAAVSAPAPAGAQTPAGGVSLALVPARVELRPGEPERVLLMLRNPGPNPITALELEALAPPGIVVTPEAVPVQALEPGAGTAWALHLERAPAGRVGPVELLLRYRARPPGAGTPLPGVVAARLEVAEAAAPAIGSVAAVSAHSALKVLEDRRQGGLVFLVITNASSSPLEVTGVRSYGPDFVAVRPQELPSQEEGGGRPAFTLPLAVPPAHSRTLPFAVTAVPPLEPGEQAVLWEVELAWEKGGRRHTGSLVAEHAFTVSVLGGSALLEVVKVPSLMMLPGALMVMTFLFFRHRVAPKVKSDLTVLKPEFWLFAVALSILAAWVYPWATGLGGQRRDFLARYGLEDIFYLWLGSLGVGLVAYLLWLGGVAAVRWERARRRALVTPAAGDSPVVTLRKLGRMGKGLALPQVEWAAAGGTQRAFELAAGAGQGGELWVAPPVALEWKGDSGSWRTRVEDQVAAGDPEALAGLLEKGEKEGRLRAYWKPVGPLGLGGPTAVTFTGDDPPRRLAPRRIVEI